jgi:hypothetical protein
MSKPILSYERLRELLHYDPETGVFTWKRCDRRTDRLGHQAGGRWQHYYRISVDKHYYQAHNLAWFYSYGQWPEGQIDHINRDGCDNRLANLRDVNASENQHNLGTNTRNWSGVTGVSWCGRTSLWVAQICHQGHRRFLGRFATISEASAARAAAKRLYHPSAPVAHQGA